MDSKAFIERFKIPKGETLWVTYISQSKTVHYITSDATRTWYYLYEVKDGKPIRIGKKAHSPLELEVHIKS